MTREPMAAAPPGKWPIFARRLGTFLVLWAAVLAALFSGHPALAGGVFVLILMALAALGLHEFYSLAARRNLPCFSRWGIAAGLLLILGTFLHFSGLLGISDSPARVNDLETSLLIVFVLGLCLRAFVSRTHGTCLLSISVTLFGLMYVAWLLNFIQKINFFPGVHGSLYVLYFLVVTKFSDSGAYVVGSLLGRHKMVPRISPGKTWEGFAGALAASLGASLLFAHLAGDRLAGMNTLHAVLLGLLLGAAAVVGDLIESLFKREAGVKDSGRLFPGVGGILDVLDSLLFNAPLMYVYLRHILTNPSFAPSL